MPSESTPREEAQGMLRECVGVGPKGTGADVLDVLTREVEKRRALEANLAEAASEINCAGPVAHRIRVLREELSAEIATLREQLAAAERQGECHHQHPMGPPGRIIQSHPATEPCLLREQALRADLATALAEGARLRAACEVGLRYVKHAMPPAPRHSCGPESGCDMECVGYAYNVRDMHTIETALSSTPTTGAVLEAVRTLAAEVIAWCEDDCDKVNVLGKRLCEVCEDVLPSHSTDCIALTARAPALRGLFEGR